MAGISVSIPNLPGCGCSEPQNIPREEGSRPSDRPLQRGSCASGARQSQLSSLQGEILPSPHGGWGFPRLVTCRRCLNDTFLFLDLWLQSSPTVISDLLALGPIFCYFVRHHPAPTTPHYRCDCAYQEHQASPLSPLICISSLRSVHTFM